MPPGFSAQTHLLRGAFRDTCTHRAAPKACSRPTSPLSENGEASREAYSRVPESPEGTEQDKEGLGGRLGDQEPEGKATLTFYWI